jgi:hypothetical protein
MTPTSRRTIALIAATAALAVPAVAHAELLPPPGPWPAPVSGASNPLKGTQFTFNGAAATANATLRVWLAGGRSALTRPAGARTILRGRLRDSTSRRPVSGAIVQLAAHNATDGGDWYLTGVTQTNHNGEFRAVLPAGPTRRIAAVYWPSVNATLPVFSRRLLVRASAHVYLRTAMLEGRRIVYRGRVSGAPIPPGGLLVAAQVKNGGSWATVRLPRTDASGNFVARYRFKHAGRRLHVRAYVPSQPAWALYSAHSHPNTVRSR